MLGDTYYSKPKRGKGKIAWEKFEIEKGFPPYCVYYTPTYDWQYKGWVCEHFPPSVLLPQCIEHLPLTFYFSNEL